MNIDKTKKDDAFILATDTALRASKAANAPVKTMDQQIGQALNNREYLEQMKEAVKNTPMSQPLNMPEGIMHMHGDGPMCGAEHGVPGNYVPRV